MERNEIESQTPPSQQLSQKSREAVEAYREGLEAGIEAQRDECANRGCMWCHEQRKK